MLEFLSKLFDTSDFPARWDCGVWTPGHGWLHILSDLGVWSAYLAIPCVLGYFIVRRKDLPFRMVFLLFGAFILACGSTHLMEAIIFWWPAYRLAGLIKLFTAVVSWATVFALVPVVPIALSMRSPEALEREVDQRRRAEEALQRSYEELERRVRERTEELALTNDALRSAKEEAEEANRAKTQFLAILSHELRTPLNPILLATSAILERPEDPVELRPTLEMIRQNVNLQARLIDDLLDVMRIVRGKMPLHWEVADCHRLINETVKICQSELNGRGLRLEVHLDATDYHVNADGARLQQVFWNLIKNAVKFTPTGGKLTIRTRNEPNGKLAEPQILIEVADTGIGIEPEMLPKIFDPFQQGETTITRQFGGLGLGLAICKGIVDAHGGIITSESDGKLRGTTIRVALKALPETSVSGNGVPHDQVAAGRFESSALRILVVEDEPMTMRLMAKILTGLGHEVTTADSVATALSGVRPGRYDLIVSDLGLPDGSGLDLIRHALEVTGPLPAIALTGYGMEEDLRRSREAGFSAHVTKPIDVAKLQAIIQQVVKIHSS